MTVAYQNNIEDYTLTGASFSDTYTVENIKDSKLTKIWKGTETDLNQSIVIDAGVAIAPQIIAILGHNFTTETISLQANDADVWGAPFFDYEFTSIDDLMFYVYTGAAYRYWRIYIENCDIPDNPPEIGLIYMGNKTTLLNPSAITPSDIDDNSVFEKSNDNTLYAYKGDVIRQNFQLKYDGLLSAEFTVLKTFFETVGKAYPFIAIWDETETFAAVPNMYCSFITGLNMGEIAGYEVPAISFTIEECN